MPRPNPGLRPGRLAPRAWLVVAALAVVGLRADRAEAQWGYGGGFWNFQYTPPEVSFLNQRAIAQAGRDTGPKQNNVYANNPNAYVNKLHDVGYLDKYDLDTQLSIERRIGRYSSQRQPTTTAAAPAQPRPAAPTQPAAPAQPDLPLSSFFDRYSKLVWPSNAPVFGDLGGKKQESDTASLAVLNEYNLRGLASLTTVTEARSKLLDYGRPALQYMRENTTPRMADSFHLFLLSLYESLAQAATRPNPAVKAPGSK